MFFAQYSRLKSAESPSFTDIITRRFQDQIQENSKACHQRTHPRFDVCRAIDPPFAKGNSILPQAVETLPDFQFRSRRQARATLLPKRRQSPIRAQHDSIIQHLKTPRSKNGRTGTLEGRSGTSIYPTGKLGSAQLLLTHTRTHTETGSFSSFHTVCPCAHRLPHRMPLRAPFTTPYALTRTPFGRTVPILDERAS